MNAKSQTPAQQALASASATGKPLFGAPSPAASSPASGSAGTSTPKVPLTSRERKERTKANKEAREAKEREAATADAAKAKQAEVIAAAQPVMLQAAVKEAPKNVKGIIAPKELRALMYGAGDVQEPLADSIDVLEDMVLAFLSDVCRAPPSVLPQPPLYLPITTNPPKLSHSIFRQRLASNPAMRKQLARFDELSFLQKDFEKIRNADQPSNAELANMGGESAKRRDAAATAEEDEAFERAMAARNAEVGEEDVEDEDGVGATPKKGKKRSAPGVPGGGGKKKKVKDGEE